MIIFFLISFIVWYSWWGWWNYNRTIILMTSDGKKIKCRKKEIDAILDKFSSSEWIGEPNPDTWDEAILRIS